MGSRDGGDWLEKMTTIYEVVVGNKIRLSTVSIGEAEDYKQQIMDDEGLDAEIKKQEVEPRQFIGNMEMD